MRKLWRRNAILAIPVIAKSKLLPHEINALVNKLEKVSFPRGKITLTGDMRTAIFIVESGKIQLAVTDGEGVVNTFDKVNHRFCVNLWLQMVALSNPVPFNLARPFWISVVI